MTTTNQASQGAASIDSAEFRRHLGYMVDQESDEFGLYIGSFIAMIDAKLAQARAEGVNAANDFRALVSDSDTAEIKEWKARAIAAESRLAEIQRGVEGLTRYEFRTGFKLNVPAAGMLPEVLGNYVMFEAVEALLQPQGQADTSGLPG